MTAQLPPPLVPLDADLRTWPAMLVDTEKVLGSGFARDTAECPEAFRAGWLLIMKSWHQQPAGSLPDDDLDLAYFTRLTPEEWKRIRPIALRSWVQCSDRRLYHPYIAKLVMDAVHKRKVSQERVGKRQDRTPSVPTAVPTAVPTVVSTAVPTAVVSDQPDSSLLNNNKGLPVTAVATTVPTAVSTAVLPPNLQEKLSEVEVEGKKKEVNLAAADENQKASDQVPLTHSQSLFEDEEVSQAKASGSSPRTLIPAGFELAPSPAIAAWAEKHGYGQIDRHLAHFCMVATNKKYQYRNWDAALRTAITRDWAGVGNTAKTATSTSSDGHSNFANVDYAMGAASNVMSMAEGVALMRAQQADREKTKGHRP